MPPVDADPRHRACLMYADHHGWLQSWLRRRLGNAHDAADLAHDTFLRLLSNHESTLIQEPRALLTTIARGIVANFHRRRRIETAYLEALATVAEHQAPSPEQRALVLETLVEIDRRLDSLPARTRRAFLLSQVDGMKQSEIAATLGVSLATVQRDLSRALHCCFFGD